MQGIYTLIIKVNDVIRFTIRKKAYIINPGFYLYNGSALGRSINIENRVKWHLRKDKKIIWHIDRITTSQQSKIIQIVYSECQKDVPGECLISKEMAKSQKFVVPIPKFGATDCKNKCPAHFFMFVGEINPVKEVWDIYLRVGFSPKLKF